ncbi:hypothetical protein [Amniculibacterium aquaticum]|uniref:hypothetical protein n=1 Tax=Amniculibacterium aquaticum TaxID=2479858 RepID=UPI000F5ABBE2|nr:hypothetical protein [Amniculibacterium aquaticum]
MYFDVTSKAEAFYEFQKDLDEKIYAIDENAFVDGIINFEKYSASPAKILWILKEPNSTEGKLHWRDEIQLIPTYNGNLGAFEKTFANIVYISHGLLNKKKWNEINWIEDEPEIVNSLEEIAFININKTPGGSKSNDNFLQNQYQNYYKEIVREQIINFKPNIIIGGNTIKFIENDLREIYPSLKYEKHVGSTNLGISISKEDNLIVFDAYHPQNTSVNREMYCSDIIDNYLSLTQND